ncbi:DUF397 domain-containing protein [Actinoplanes subglobosus]|uniref:DUF397 domain-containing protein n=1 Tax=Actinoplanes subglobosus TaxID=1547892 RepID=A0ABV8IX96_9ACTN
MQSGESTDGLLTWRRSSFCNNGACVEVAFFEGSVFVRDTKDPQREPIAYSSDEWRAFIAGVKGGEFDL